MPNFHTWFHALEMPFRGLRSKPHITTLGPGEFAVCTNWRCTEDLLKVRYPMTRLAGWGTFTGKASGARTVTLNGTEHILLVDNDDGSIVSFDTQSGTATTVTSSDVTSKYGDTRLNNGAHDQCCFATFRDVQAEKEYAVISDGVGALRIFDPLSAVVGGKVALANSITVPTGVFNLGIVPTFPKYFTISNATNTSCTPSDADIVYAESGGATDNYISLTFGSTVDVDDNAPVTMGAAIDLSGCKQLIIYSESKYTGWIENWKVELIDAGGNVTIWDPSASTGFTSPFPIRTSARECFYVYDLARASSSACTGLKFTFKGVAPGASQTFNIYGVFGSGAVRGAAAHTLTYVNSGSRVESPGIMYTPYDSRPEYTKNLGSRSTVLTKIPYDTRLFYQYTIPYLNTSTAQMQAGVDQLRIYRSDVGEDANSRSLVATVSLATWTPGSPGAWAFDSGSALSARTYNDNNDVSVKNGAIMGPDANVEAPPKHVVWCESTEERLYLASFDYTGSNDPAFSAIWASDVFNPMRFRRFHSDESNGTMRACQGEIATRLMVAPSGVAGVSTMFVWTSKQLYYFTATSATSINKWIPVCDRGTLTPYSCVIGDGDLYWLDQFKHVIRYGSRGMEDLSHNTIQDKLDTICSGAATGWNYVIPLNQRLAFGGWFDKNYYLSVDQAGTGSLTSDTEEPLVYQTRKGKDGREFGWVVDDLGGSTYSTRYWCPAKNSLFVVSKDGKVYKYEDSASGQATDGYYYTGSVPGTSYTATLKTGSFFPGMRGDGAGLVVTYTDIMCDDVNSGTCTYTYNYLPSGGAPTQTASIDASSSVKWCTPSAAPSGETQGGLAVSIQAVFSSGCAGMGLYGGRIRYESRDIRPSV